MTHASSKKKPAYITNITIVFLYAIIFKNKAPDFSKNPEILFSGGTFSLEMLTETRNKRSIKTSNKPKKIVIEYFDQFRILQ